MKEKDFFIISVAFHLIQTGKNFEKSALLQNISKINKLRKSFVACQSIKKHYETPKLEFKHTNWIIAELFMHLFSVI